MPLANNAFIFARCVGELFWKARTHEGIDAQRRYDGVYRRKPARAIKADEDDYAGC